MSERPKAASRVKPDQSSGKQGRAPAFAADEPQPSSAINEHDALSEREDGANRG